MRTATDRAGVATDDGFSLIEVVVAMAVFAVTAAVALGAIVSTSDVAGANIRRTAATNLAMRQIESVRSQAAEEIPDGLQTSTETVGGITYTIRQTAKYATGDSSTNLCSSTGSALAYKSVTVIVTWPDMGPVKPIRADTLKSVGIGSGALDQSTKGTLALLVSGATGSPRSDVQVTLSTGASQTTGEDGCVVFAGLAPGGYTATASMAGWSGVDNTRTAVSGSLGVTAATVSRGTLMYDTERRVQVALDAAPGAVVPAGLPLRLGNSYVPERTYPVCSGTPTAACTSGTPGVVQGLFPENYTVKIGTCPMSGPSQATIDLRAEQLTPPTVTVPMGTITVDVRLAGVSVGGRTVTVTTRNSGCTGPETYTVVLPAAGGTPIALPYGQWDFSTPNAGTDHQQVSNGNRTASITLTVSA